MSTLAQLPSSLRALPSTPLELVGVPYARGGVSPELGFDCYTLLAFVRWHYFKRITPVGTIPARTLPASRACVVGIRRALGHRDALPSPWERITTAREGCAVALGLSRIGRLHHCGVWIASGVLQAMDGIGVAWTPGERIRDLFARVEFYELCAS